MTDAMHDFLTRLLRARPARVVFDKAYVSDDRPTLLVGCGAWPAAGQPLLPNQFILNNKGVHPRYGRSYSSLVKLATDPPPQLADSEWPALWSAWPTEPDAVLADVVLVVEDASPDSVLGVIALLARRAGLDFAAHFPAWVETIDAWERTGTADDPWTHWCALASALAHAHIPPFENISSENTDAAAPDDTWALAWRDVLSFAADCLIRAERPDALPQSPDSPTWARATAALKQEEATYFEWLKHATVVQLSLPLAGFKGRRTLVDGLLFVEDQVTGGAKALYRNDRQNAPLGRGFSLSAHYRPSLAGTGNDFTVAVDPRVGVHLRDLWKELERRENAAWVAVGVERPSDKPRGLDGVDNRYNQPWFVTPDATLIAAPKEVSPGTPGTRLQWEDVLSAIWTVFDPLKDIKLNAFYQDDLKSLPELLSIRQNFSGKNLLMARWPRRSDDSATPGPRSMSTAPVILQVMAALLQPARTTRPELADLPPPGAWRQVSLSAGFAIVTDDGMFIFDDWREKTLPFELLRTTFDAAARFDHELTALQKDTIAPLVAEIDGILTQAGRWPDLDAPVRRAALASCRLAQIRGGYALFHADPDARAIRDMLDKCWGLSERLSALADEVAAVETSLRSLNEAKLAGVGRFVAHYAFPIVVADVFGPTIAKFIHPWINSCLALSTISWLKAPESGDPPAAFTLIILIFMLLFGLGLLKLYKSISRTLL